MSLFREQFRIESARRVGWDYGSRGWYFVTICTKDKKCTLGTVSDHKIVLSKAGAIADDEMQRIAKHYSNVTIDRFVIMANHVHAIIVIEGDHVYSPHAGDGASPVSTAGSLRATMEMRANSLADIVGGYKAGVTRICHAEGIADFAWQARFHDHILRSNSTVKATRDYIDKNPEGWVEDPDGPAGMRPPEQRRYNYR
jgi:putative transposase